MVFARKIFHRVPRTKARRYYRGGNACSIDYGPAESNLRSDRNDLWFIRSGKRNERIKFQYSIVSCDSFEIELQNFSKCGLTSLGNVDQGSFIDEQVYSICAKVVSEKRMPISCSLSQMGQCKTNLGKLQTVTSPHRVQDVTLEEICKGERGR